MLGEEVSNDTVGDKVVLVESSSSQFKGVTVMIMEEKSSTGRCGSSSGSSSGTEGGEDKNLEIKKVDVTNSENVSVLDNSVVALPEKDECVVNKEITSQTQNQGDGTLVVPVPVAAEEVEKYETAIEITNIENDGNKTTSESSVAVAGEKVMKRSKSEHADSDMEGTQSKRLDQDHVEDKEENLTVSQEKNDDNNSSCRHSVKEGEHDKNAVTPTATTATTTTTTTTTAAFVKDLRSNFESIKQENYKEKLQVKFLAAEPIELPPLALSDVATTIENTSPNIEHAQMKGDGLGSIQNQSVGSSSSSFGNDIPQPSISQNLKTENNQQDKVDFQIGSTYSNNNESGANNDMEAVGSLSVRANDIINIKLVGNLHDFDFDKKVGVCSSISREGDGENITATAAAKFFHPMYTHQQFGDTEKVYGYKNPNLRLYYTSCTMKPFCQFTFDNKIKNADNIQDKIIELMPTSEAGELTACPNEFIEYVKEQQGLMKTNPSKLLLGELVMESYTSKPSSSSSSSSSSNEKQKFQIRQCTSMTPGFSKFHARIQSLLQFYIDGAVFIDFEDPTWSFYLIYEFDENIDQWAFVGYATLYNFFAYPDKVRPRISQVLILPPFQRKGYGSTLLQCIYDALVPSEKTLEITIEDANTDLQTMRDVVDLQNLKSLLNTNTSSSSSHKSDHIETVTEATGSGLEEKDKEYKFTIETLPERFNDTFFQFVRSSLKLNKGQTRKLYEMLKLYYTDRSNAAAYKKYRLMIKNRIHHEFKDHLDTLSSKSEKLMLLDAVYKETENYYQEILNRITV